MDEQLGRNYLARKALFAKGLRQGRLTVKEIDSAFPPGTLTDAERWLLYYSLHAAQVEIVGEETEEADTDFVELDAGRCPDG